MKSNVCKRSDENRRAFIGGSDARIIMGSDEAALLRLWQEKRGEIEPEDLSGNLIVQLGLVTEPLNRDWYERNTGQIVECLQHRLRTSGAPVDGGDPGRHRCGQRGGVRGEIHAAVVVLGGGSGREAYGSAPAQHVGHQCHRRGALNYHRRRQVGRDQDTSRFALSAPPFDGGKEILALRRERRAPSRSSASSHRELALRRCGSWT